MRFENAGFLCSPLALGATKLTHAAILKVLCLAGIMVERLPTPSTIHNMVVEAGVISKLHLGEVLPTTTYNTLHTDSTTKSKAYQVSTTEASYSLALCELKLAVQLTHWKFLTKPS